jgi:hypothetical protein
MYHLTLVLTNLKAWLSVKVELKFETEADCTEEEYDEGLYELIAEAIHQYRGADYMNEIKQSHIYFGTALDLVKSWGYRYHEYESDCA